MPTKYFILSAIISCLLVLPSYGSDDGRGVLSRDQAIDIAAHHLIGKSFDVVPPSTVTFNKGKYTVTIKRQVPNGAAGETYTSKIVFDAKTLEALEIEINTKNDASATRREFAVDGFRGVPSNSDLSERADMIFHEETGSTTYYTRRGESFKLGNGDLINLYFGAHRKRFYVVLAQFRGSDNREKIKHVLFREFGKPFKPDANRSDYIWTKGDTTATLMYDEQTKVGTVIYSFDPVDREVNR